MSQPRVLLGLTDSNDHQLEELAGHVLAGLFTSALYPAPPVQQADVEDALEAFTNGIAAVKEGGPRAAANKERARQKLIGLLRQLAAYVTATMLAHPAYGLPELLASGFEAVSTNRAQHPLDTPEVYGVDNAGEGQLRLRVRAIRNARQYEVRYQSAPGAEWSPGHLFDSTRDMIVADLTPGAMYTLQVRALGGATGSSQWSDAVSHRSL